MKVWQVGVSDCEASHTICICLTKEIALREMFKKRDDLIAEWKRMKEYYAESTRKFIEEKAKQKIHFGFSGDDRNMWQDMIDALSNDDYENWNNYPHEVPWICETEIVAN